MIFSQAFIDQIVHNVMRELNLPQTSTTAAPPADQGAAVPTAGAGSRPVSLNARVLTEDVLAARVPDGSTISIESGTVMTPSARDYLRQHRIQIARPAAAAGSNGRLITVGTARGLQSAADAAGWQQEEAGGGFDAANRIAQQCTGLRTVCGTTQPSLVACLLNRNTARRVAVIDHNTCLDDLLQDMNPDTVCLSPTGWAFGDLLRLFRRLDGSAPQSPTDWRELG